MNRYRAFRPAGALEAEKFLFYTQLVLRSALVECVGPKPRQLNDKKNP